MYRSFHSAARINLFYWGCRSAGIQHSGNISGKFGKKLQSAFSDSGCLRALKFSLGCTENYETRAVGMIHPTTNIGMFCPSTQLWWDTPGSPVSSSGALWAFCGRTSSNGFKLGEGRFRIIES